MAMLPAIEYILESSQWHLFDSLLSKTGRKLFYFCSWPVLNKRSSESRNVKNPAVISPLIRSLVRLWCHENTRAYGDRLLTEEQRFWFASTLHEQVEEYFCKDKFGRDDKTPEPGQMLKGTAIYVGSVSVVILCICIRF